MKKLLLIPFLLCSLNALTHTVQYGDTLYKISKKYGVSVQEIKKNNDMLSNVIVAGQKLTITPSSSLSTGGKTHTLQEGDTLYQISKKYGVKISELLSWNEITDARDLKVGSILRVGSETAPTIAHNALPTSEPSLTQSTTSFEQDGRESYVMQKGDTLYGVAKRYGLNYQDLIAWNDIATPSSISIGQKIKLSGNAVSESASPSSYESELYDDGIGVVYGDHPYQEISSQGGNDRGVRHYFEFLISDRETVFKGPRKAPKIYRSK